MLGSDQLAAEPTSVVPQSQWCHYRTSALSPFGQQGIVYL
eukprot:SAG11_NODE_32903_length_280_cov_0.574586_1_plen_39_part_01